ncbi:MAG TPA: DNA/RNA helicase, partial [Phormidium sp.]
MVSQMAVGNEDQGRKFITTEPLEASTEAGEQKVWDAVRSAFADRNCLGYWRYPLFSKVGETRKEPDILIADKEFNLIVIEVLSITLDQIIEIHNNLWQFQNFSTTEANPYQQAEGQLNGLIAYCDRETAICGKVTGRALVALPRITQKEWQENGFDQLPNCPSIIFQEHLSETGLLERIQQSNPAIAGSNLDEQQWELMLAVIGGTTVLRKPSRTLGSSNDKTRGSIIAALQEKLYELDFQQEHIGKGIPPGIQRMRGIAGSGKTVLLFQKAAHIHLKHPDWDIA